MDRKQCEKCGNKEFNVTQYPHNTQWECTRCKLVYVMVEGPGKNEKKFPN